MSVEPHIAEILEMRPPSPSTLFYPSKEAYVYGGLLRLPTCKHAHATEQPVYGQNPGERALMTNVLSDGHDESTLSDRYYGRTPPRHGDKWEATTITRHVVTSGEEADETVTCKQTGEKVSLGEQHLYPTARKDRDWHTPAFVHFMFRDETALEAWFNDG